MLSSICGRFLHAGTYIQKWIVKFSSLAGSYFLCWIACHDTLWRDILCHDRTGAHNGAGANFKPGTNKRFCGNPGTVSNKDWTCYKRKTRIAKIMTGRAEVRALAHDAVALEVDLCGRVAVSTGT